MTCLLVVAKLLGFRPSSDPHNSRSEPPHHLAPPDPWSPSAVSQPPDPVFLASTVTTDSPCSAEN